MNLFRLKHDNSKSQKSNERALKKRTRRREVMVRNAIAIICLAVGTSFLLLTWGRASVPRFTATARTSS